eukprot:1158796-Pelagomonas_calceolata.AAC.2
MPFTQSCLDLDFMENHGQHNSRNWSWHELDGKLWNAAEITLLPLSCYSLCKTNALSAFPLLFVSEACLTVMSSGFES